MSKIFRRNVFTGEFESADVDTSMFTKAAPKDERKSYSTAYSTPRESVAAGCHSNQVKDFNEFYKERGISGAYHREDGTLLVDSNGAMNAVLEARGLYDRDAGYGQFAGNAKDE